jgi:hypothetical protein
MAYRTSICRAGGKKAESSLFAGLKQVLARGVGKDVWRIQRTYRSDDRRFIETLIRVFWTRLILSIRGIFEFMRRFLLQDDGMRNSVRIIGISSRRVLA